MPMNNRLLRPTTGLDPDAAKYLAAVEAADGEPLEPAVRTAINAFFKDLKATPGLFDAIKASCILCGARTITGALVPLAGPSPSAEGAWASGDYDRSAGLTGNATSLWIDTNFLSDGLSNDSVCAFVNGMGFNTSATGFACPIGVFDAVSGAASLVDIAEYQATGRRGRIGSDADVADSVAGILSDCSIAVSATSSTSLTLYQNGVALDSESASRSASLSDKSFGVFARNQPPSSPAGLTDATINLYAICDGLDSSSVSSLHTAVTNLITAIGNEL